MKICYYGLVCACKQLHQEAIPIFFNNNTFQLWVQDKTPRISDTCSRLIRNLDVVAIIGNRLRYVVACIEIRGTTIGVTVDGKTWSIPEHGMEGARCLSTHEHHADTTCDRLERSVKMLHEPLQADRGIGIETLKKVQRTMDRAS
jgi:hypothetical protein